MAAITRLGTYGYAARQWGSFLGRVPAPIVVVTPDENTGGRKGKKRLTRQEIEWLRDLRPVYREQAREAESEISALPEVKRIAAGRAIEKAVNRRVKSWLSPIEAAEAERLAFARELAREQIQYERIYLSAIAARIEKRREESKMMLLMMV